MKKRAPSGRREEIEKYRQELDSLQWMASNAKVCPRCKTVIEKTEGCMVSYLSFYKLTLLY